MSKEELKDRIEECFTLLKGVLVSIGSKEDCNADELSKLSKLAEYVQAESQKVNFLSDEDITQFSDDIDLLNKDNEKLKQEHEALANKLATQEKELKSSFDAKLKMETEILKDKLKAVSNGLEEEKGKSSSLAGRLASQDSQISELRAALAQSQQKYNNLLDENEITNQNLKRSFGLDRKLLECEAENAELKLKLANINFAEIDELKSWNSKSRAEIASKNKLLSSYENEISNLKASVAKLKDENFTKFDRINALENEIKGKNARVNELLNASSAAKAQLSSVLKDKEEAEIRFKSSERSLESKSNQLKIEIESLKQQCDKHLKANNDLKKQLDNLGRVSSFAKANKEDLSKKDFSILETMSRRVEELELLNDTLRDQVSEVSIENKKLTLKLNTLLKNDSDEVSEIFGDMVLSDEDAQELKSLHLTPDFLFQFIVDLKKQNCSLLQQITQITIECNKMMREQA